MVWRVLTAGNRIATRFYAAVGFTCVITLITIVNAWVAFERVNSSQNLIFERTLPESEVVVGIARASGAIVAVVPRITASASQQELELVSAAVADLRREFTDQLTGMSGLSDVKYSSISEKGDLLLEVVSEIERSMHRLFAVRQRSERFRERLGRIEQTIRHNLVPMIDDQYFYVITGRRELDQVKVPEDEQFRPEGDSPLPLSYRN